MTAVLIAAVFFTLNTGQTADLVSSARSDLQAQVRRLLDWISTDVRQSISWEIANNNCTDSYIRFRQVEGWDTTNSTYQLSSDRLEYTYNATPGSITRRLSDASNNTLNTWTFNNITQAPFYTRDAAGNVTALNQGDLLTSRKLVIVIAGSKQVKSSLNLTCDLTAEVKIRNE